MYQPTEKNTEDRILMFIKMKGSVTIQTTATELSITKEGARLHLKNLLAKDLILEESISQGKGRPSKEFLLSEKGLAKFPNTHADLTVNIIQSIRSVLGESALEAVINERENKAFLSYSNSLAHCTTLEDRLYQFASLRTSEGYMAEIIKINSNEFYFIENHCPICAAATECQQFCRGEFSNLQKLFGEWVSITRTQHIIEGANRCSYQFKVLKPE